MNPSGAETTMTAKGTLLDAHLPTNRRGPRHLRVWRQLTVTAAVLLAVAGCTSGGRDEHPAAPGASTSAAPTPNPGNYPTKVHPLGASGSPAIGAVTEARRMGENVVFAFQVDPTLTKIGNREGPFTDLGMLASWFDRPIRDAAANHHFLAGFLGSGITAGPHALGQPREKELMNGVLRFASDADAGAAASEMAAHSVVLEPLFTDEPPRPTTPAPIARHPETTAFGYTDKLGGSVVQAYTVHGTYVFVQWATTAAGPQPTADLIAGAIDQQLPLIDAFVPTPEDQLAALPRDPTGLFARTLPPDKNSSQPPGDYGPHAALAFMTNGPRTQKVFDHAGVDMVAISRANVYRARDADGAGAITADYIAEMKEQGWLPAPAVPAVPGSQCLRQKPGTNPVKPNTHFFYCMFSAGRYAVEVQGPQRGDVHQAAAAQYLLATAP